MIRRWSGAVSGEGVMLTQTVAGRPSPENEPGLATQHGQRQDQKPLLPRSPNLITGAIGTAGIEGSYVRGAHGPRHVCIAPVEG